MVKGEKSAIKRPLSAYIFFGREMRKTMDTSNMEFGEITKTIADEWNKTTSRGKWQKMATEDKARYAKQMKKGGGSEKITKKKKAKRANKVKKSKKNSDSESDSGSDE